MYYESSVGTIDKEIDGIMARATNLGPIQDMGNLEEAEDKEKTE